MYFNINGIHLGKQGICASRIKSCPAAKTSSSSCITSSDFQSSKHDQVYPCRSNPGGRGSGYINY